MLKVIASAWALLLGIMLLMVGNGMQGTLLGLRGAYEGFSTFEMSMVMSAYFIGFLGGSRSAPEMIRRVGHVRVFAALASFVSAVLILYPTFAHPMAWVLGRVAIGFCFSGVYVTAESWLNHTATNESRGQALSIYMIVQLAGIILAQGLVNVGDISGYLLFVIPSVLVSISFAPILLSISPTPTFDSTKPMTLRKLYDTSPTGCVGMFLLGGVFSAQFGMASVFGTQAGLTTPQISVFVSAFFFSALFVQYPVGWLSDRMDRRLLIVVLSAIGAGGAGVGMVFAGSYLMLLLAALLIGAVTNPLYALIIAYTNDYLDFDDMASASGGLLFINGLGAIAGPMITGWMMGVIGPRGFFLFIVLLLLVLVGYAAYRMTVRPAPAVEDTSTYAPLYAASTAVALEAAHEYAQEVALEEEAQAEADQQAG